MKLALAIGINNYPGTGSDLSGCVNDAWDWYQVLTDRGYTVNVMQDRDATKARVVERLTEYVGRLRAGDSLVLCYSGHGTWVPDESGDEEDKRDEAMCLYDFDSGGLLTDDELHEILGRAAAGSSVLILSDSCHSGTLAKLFQPARVAPARFLPPSLIHWLELAAERAAELEADADPCSPPRLGAALISGCADPEYSYDASFGGRPNGAFTRAAIDTLPEATSLEDWYYRIRERLPTTEYPQTPQLTATPEQKSGPPIP